MQKELKNDDVLVVSYLFPFGQMQDSFFEDELLWLRERISLRIIPVARKKHHRRFARYQRFSSEVASVDIGQTRIIWDLRWITLSISIILRALHFELREALVRRESLRNIARVFREGAKVWAWSLSSRSLSSLRTPTAVYSLWAGTPGICAYIMARYFNTGLVMRYHGQDLYEDRNGFIPFNRYISQRDSVSNVFLGISAREYFHTNVSNLDTRSEVIPLSISIIEKVSARPESATVRFLTVSNDVPLKRLDLAHACLTRLSKERKIEWEHVGLLRSETKQLLEKTSRNLSFKFLGEMEQSELRKQMLTGGYACLLSFSDSEGMPYSLTQALYLGIPVISTSVGAVQDIAALSAPFLLPRAPKPETFVTHFNGVHSLMLEDGFRQGISERATAQFSPIGPANKILSTLIEANHFGSQI